MYIYIHISVRLLQEVKLRKIRHKISFAVAHINECVVFCPHPNNSSSPVKHGAGYAYLANKTGN